MVAHLLRSVERNEHYATNNSSAETAVTLFTTSNAVKWLVVVSDASGLWGCGAVHENLWFQLQWPETWAAVSIAPK